MALHRSDKAFRDLVRKNRGIPEDALWMYYNEWSRTGDSKEAWGFVREHGLYDRWFPGNLLDNGSVRYDERQYGKIVDAYYDVYRTYGLKIDFLKPRIRDLIVGEVSPAEFRSRAKQTWERIIVRSDQVKRYYQDQLGLGNISNRHLMAAAMDPSISDAVLSGTMDVAEVGGAFDEHDFASSLVDIQRLVESGVGYEEASDLAGKAAMIVPVMSVLAKRHNDPNDEFNVNDFLASEFFQDPEANYRMRRDIAAERSMFNTDLTMKESRAGGLTGLIAE